jgi:hypothetical protein
MVFAADVGLWRAEDGWLLAQSVCRVGSWPKRGSGAAFLRRSDTPAYPLLLRCQRTIGSKETRFGLLTDLLTDRASRVVILRNQKSRRWRESPVIAGY